MSTNAMIGISAAAIVSALLCVAGAIVWSFQVVVIRQADRTFAIYDRWNQTVQTCFTGTMRARGRFTECGELEQVITRD